MSFCTYSWSTPRDAAHELFELLIVSNDGLEMAELARGDVVLSEDRLVAQASRQNHCNDLLFTSQLIGLAYSGELDRLNCRRRQL